MNKCLKFLPYLTPGILLVEDYNLPRDNKLTGEF